MMKKCVNCPSGKLAPGLVSHSRNVGEHTFTAKLPALVCGACGEDYLQGKVLLRFELEVARRLTEADAVAPEAVQFIRKVLGVRGKELAELLDVAAATVSRWEKGHRAMDRAAVAVLHALIAEKIEGHTSTREYLERMGKARRLPKTVQLEWRE